MNTSKIRRGDIYYADLDPAQGSEQGGLRPVLIVQNDTGNAHSPTTQTVPLTTQTQKGRLPTHVRISKACGLSADSIALVEQLRTLDKSRLDAYVGRIRAKEQSAIDKALSVSVGLEDNRRPQITERTLCPRCKADYETSGYKVVKRGWQEYKEECDYCQTGMGFTYAVFDKEERR